MSYFRRTRITYAVIVALALAIGHASFTGWAIVLVFGGVSVLLGSYARRMAVSHVAADAVRALLADDADGAEAVLQRARAANVPLGAAPLSVASVEAEIALLRGDVVEVRRVVDAALRRPRDPVDPVSDATSRRELAAVGAIARATANDADGALQAAQTVEADEASSPRARARVTLARAILLARAGRREELGALLRERRTVLDLGASARERALARAFARLARLPASSVYRRNAARVEAAAGWIEAAAGDAAGLLVRREESDAPLQPAVTTVSPREPPAALTPPRGKTSRMMWLRVAIVWSVVIALGVAILERLPPEAADVSHVEVGVTPLLGPLDLVGAVAILIAGAVLVRRVRAVMFAWDRTPRLVAAYVRGSETEALDGLAAIAREPNRVLAAQASLSLAALAIVRGEPTAARTAAESGLARLATREVRLATADLLYPELIAQWAFALAAEGDPAAARGALASMPPYCRAVRSRFRVELLARWREGDEAGAADWAERGARDTAVGAEDEVLADAIRAAVRGDALGGGELRRIADEVGDPSWRRFLDGVAPGVAPRVLALSSNADGDPAVDSADAEAEAERDAAAEEEIARHIPLLASS